MSPETYFSASYSEARQKFCTAAQDAGAQTSALENPEPGPAGERLTTDLAVFGEPDAPAVLFCNSATHGVEGFGGSGIQVGLLQSGLLKDPPIGVQVVVSHALNPHGFAAERRVTEGNVDLNRNFQDFVKPLPENADYAQVHELLLPADWDGPAKAQADRDIAAYIETNGMDAFQSAVSRGQYSHPDGLFYGGTAATWSNGTWRAILRRFGRGRARIATVDLHTGLGPSGHGEVITGSPFVERARAWYGADVTSPQEGGSVSTVLTGYMATAVEEEVPEAEQTSVTLEFGTLPLTEVLDALRADHWLHRAGGLAHPLAGEIKSQVRAAFYTETPAWKKSLWERGEFIVRRALAGLSGSA